MGKTSAEEIERVECRYCLNAFFVEDRYRRAFNLFCFQFDGRVSAGGNLHCIFGMKRREAFIRNWLAGDCSESSQRIRIVRPLEEAQ